MLRKFLLCLSLCLCGFLCAAADNDEGFPAITRPSKDVVLAFTRPGLISAVNVKEGDQVKANQVLVQLDDGPERDQVEVLKAQAENTIRIAAAVAQLEQKVVDFKKLEEAFKAKAVSNWDVEHAKLDVSMAEMSLELTKFEHTQDKRKYEEAKKQLARMRILSPIAGKVENVLLREGESADALQEVVRVVKIDPLWVQVPVDMGQARTLKVGGTATVTFAGTPAESGEGKIIHIAAMADAASATLGVRVELPNPTGRPGGEHVTVKFK